MLIFTGLQPIDLRRYNVSFSMFACPNLESSSGERTSS